jgi:hypothetical protein
MQEMSADSERWRSAFRSDGESRFRDDGDHCYEADHFSAFLGMVISIAGIRKN